MGEKEKVTNLTKKAKTTSTWTRDEWVRFKAQMNGGIPSALTGAQASNFGFSKDTYEDLEPSQVREKILGDDISDIRKLSRDYFKISGFYARTLYHLSTLQLWQTYLVPIPKKKEFNIEDARESLYEGFQFMSATKITKQMQYITLMMLIDGAYYGLVYEDSETGGVLLQQLPVDYCKTTEQTLSGVAKVDFDVSYFDAIRDDEDRDVILSRMPKVISNGYKEYKSGKEQSGTLSTVNALGGQKYYVTLEPNEGVAFVLPEERPPLISVIPAVVNLDIYRDMELSRDEADLHRVLVQKIPMGKNGEMLLELEEIAVLHETVADMLSATPNIDLVTTFADVEAVQLKDTRQLSRDNIEKVSQSVYTEAGVSRDIFAPTNSLAVQISLNNDLAYIMNLTECVRDWLEWQVSERFSGKTYWMSVNVLPTTVHNRKELTELYRSNATYGGPVSLMLISMGTPQWEIEGLLKTEQEILGLRELMVPLQSSNTQSAKDENKGGRPELDLQDKDDKTIRNIDSEGVGD